MQGLFPVNAPLVLRQLTPEWVSQQLPDLSEDLCHSALLTHALEYGMGNREVLREECGLTIRAGIAQPDFGLCIIEITDENIRKKFNFAKFYVYKGFGLATQGSMRAETVPHNNIRSAMSSFHAEQNS